MSTTLMYNIHVLQVVQANVNYKSWITLNTEVKVGVGPLRSDTMLKSLNYQDRHYVKFQDVLYTIRCNLILLSNKK